jgi:hypothetical protein
MMYVFYCFENVSDTHSQRAGYPHSVHPRIYGGRTRQNGVRRAICWQNEKGEKCPWSEIESTIKMVKHRIIGKAKNYIPNRKRRLLIFFMSGYTAN